MTPRTLACPLMESTGQMPKSTDGCSGVGEDLLGADAVDSVGGAFTREHAVVIDGVDRSALGDVGSRCGGGPLGGQGVAAETGGALVNAAGDQPFDSVESGVVGSHDGDRSRVLDPGGVDPVDAVDAGDALTVLERVPGEGAPAEPEADESGRNRGGGAGGDGAGGNVATQSHGFILPRWAKAAIGTFVLIIVGAMAFAIFQPITVLPRMQLAPGFGVTDQAGNLFTSEDTRGTVTLYSFSTLDCDDRCQEMADTVATVQASIATDPNLAEVDVRFVTIALDADATPEQLAETAESVGADGEEWRWVGGSETQLSNLVGVGFRRYFETEPDGSTSYDSGYVIVDGWGVVRGDYKYQTLSDDGDKLARHLGMLGTEIRYANGAGAFAYEAAHLFSCYP